MNYKNTYTLRTAGVDEAGRGALAGPVVAAAVILGPKSRGLPLMDSKQLSASKREYLYQELHRLDAVISVFSCSASMIDKINILNASLRAMKYAILRLHPQAERAFIDGNKLPPAMPITCKAFVKGDTLIPEISAASIIAKVTRDRIMTDCDAKYPQYGFAIHKGYATRAHYEALNRIGICPLHRLSFNLHTQQSLFL